MVERKPLLDWLSHGILVVGVAIVALPIWIAFAFSLF
jgi:hypothetical protein